MYRNLNLEALGISARDSEMIELVLSHGFKGLDLDLSAFAEQVKAQGLERAARLIKSARLKIGSFRLPLRWEDDAHYATDLQHLKPLADIAAQLGCTRTTTLIAPGDPRLPYHENFEFHRRRLAEVADHLAEHKIKLGVGFLAPAGCRTEGSRQFVQTCDETLLLLRSVSSSNIGLALDSWHWHLGGGTLDRLQSLAAGTVVTVSLADADAGLDRATATLEQRRLPGDGGVIDHAAMLAALSESGYDGPVSLAPDQSQFKGLGRDAIVKNTAASLDRVWKAAGLNAAGKRATVPGR